MRDATRRGLDLIVVDPRRTELAKMAALHLPVRPGEDSALLGGMLRIVIDERLYDVDFVERFREEMLGYFETIAADHTALGLDRLVILRAGDTHLFSQGAIGEMADRAVQLWGPAAEFRTAIVAEKTAQFGLSRMYSLRCARPDEKQRAFHDVQEARSWLGR